MRDGGKAKAGKTQTNEAMAGQAPDWGAVRDFLQAHPALVREDADLLSHLGLRINAANVVEFGPAALARQAAAHRRESDARRELEATARANFAAQAQCHAGVVDLLESRNNADLARRLDETARIRFDLLGAAIGVEGSAPAGWRPLAAGQVDRMLGAQGQAWMGPNAFADSLFGALPAPIESCALVRLALWRDGHPGVLAFASAEPDGFTPDMGVELIALLARVVERTAERWPVL
ncbi:MAG TPA: DUF484 family protein [Caulobacteraceae bacterium]|nr:DUF484 family protein [Caulobacteraceae bacterium]